MGKAERGGYSWGLGDGETGRQGDRKKYTVLEYSKIKK